MLAKCYDPVSVSVSVCQFVASRRSIETDGVIWFLAWGSSFSQSYTACFNKIQVSTKHLARSESLLGFAADRFIQFCRAHRVRHTYDTIRYEMLY